jgi:hypothetical protein
MVIDEVQDALNANSKEPHTKKIKLENGTTFQAGIWHAGDLVWIWCGSGVDLVWF